MPKKSNKEEMFAAAAELKVPTDAQLKKIIMAAGAVVEERPKPVDTPEAKVSRNLTQPGRNVASTETVAVKRQMLEKIVDKYEQHLDDLTIRFLVGPATFNELLLADAMYPLSVHHLKTSYKNPAARELAALALDTLNAALSTYRNMGLRAKVG